MGLKIATCQHEESVELMVCFVVLDYKFADCTVRQLLHWKKGENKTDYTRQHCRVIENYEIRCFFAFFCDLNTLAR